MFMHCLLMKVMQKNTLQFLLIGSRDVNRQSMAVKVLYFSQFF